MDISMRLNRSKMADLFIAIVAMAPAVAIYWGSFSPEAAVYFTYIRNFFQLPFSFQPDTVNFGATSPLHVMLHAPILAVFGKYWIFASKFLNLLLVALGMVLVNRALKGGTKTILLISLLVGGSTALLVSTSQLFETGLAFFVMAWIYYDLTEKKYERATLMAGLLYLIRPELFVVAVAVWVWVVLQAKASKRSLTLVGFALAPMFVYHIYMLIAGGKLFPSAMFVPIVTYIQDPTSWLERVGLTLSALWSASGLIYIAAGIVILLLSAEFAFNRYTKEILLVAPLVVLYLIFPPKDLIVRYLVPITPILIATIVRYVQQELKAQYTVKALIVCLFLAHGYGSAAASRMPHYNQSAELLKDLSGQLNTVAKTDEPVLLYDIQGQYYINAPCYSMTAAVGDEILDVHLKRTPMGQFMLEDRVKYVVVSEELGSSYLFDNTLLEKLYEHDLESAVGDTVELEGVAFQKMFSNPMFVKASARLASAKRERGTVQEHPRMQTQWNSVYSVLGDAQTVKAQRLAASYRQLYETPSYDTTGVTPTIDSSTAAQPGMPTDSLTTHPAGEVSG